MSNATTVAPEGETDILITRQFDAPRALVFRAWTTPELVRRWWTAGRGEMSVCEIDLRPGGAWRFATTPEPGDEALTFYGEYREIDAPERLVFTEIFAPYPDNPALNSVALEERDGRTYATVRISHTSEHGRDMHLQSGLETGMNDALDSLDEVAQSLAA